MAHLAHFLLFWIVLPLVVAAGAQGWLIRHREHIDPILPICLLHQVRLAVFALAAYTALSYNPSPRLLCLLVLGWGIQQWLVRSELARVQAQREPGAAEQRHYLALQVLPALAVLLYMAAEWSGLRINNSMYADGRILREALHHSLFWPLLVGAIAVWLLHLEELLRGTGPLLRRSNTASPTRLGHGRF